MKILLFGEYSGFFNCLKDGLVTLGHEVSLVSFNGDGVKNFPSDFKWEGKHYAQWQKVGLGAVYATGNLMHNRNLLKGYDVVLLIAPNEVSYRVWLNKIPYKYIRKHNKRVYLSGAGITAHLFEYWYNSNEKYKSYMEGYLIDNKNFFYKDNPSLLKCENELLDMVDGYIPIWYEYYMPFKSNPKCMDVVRIPVNSKIISYKPNIIKDKMVFYHGGRCECKGSRFIKAAFEKMKKAYGDKCEFICAGMIPFKDYMALVERTNVIVDDANSYSIAMNGLFSMLKGKLIMGGAEPVANEMYGYKYNPVFNICPDVDQICETIIDIINRKDEIESIGQKGRKFVEEYHDYIDIAKQYESIFIKGLTNIK